MITQNFLESFVYRDGVVSCWKMRWWWSGVQWRAGLDW